ncbi:hypothetical protein H8D30_06580 [bacterium]|nr:hypothetical protein [bacterium]
MNPFLLLLLLSPVTPCSSARIEAHSLADIARNLFPVELFFVAPPSSPFEEGAVQEGLDVVIFSLQGETVRHLMGSIGRDEGEEFGEPLGMSGIWSETDESGETVFRLWVSGAPTSPHRIHTVGVDLRLLGGKWAGALIDPLLPPPTGYDRGLETFSQSPLSLHLEGERISLEFERLDEAEVQSICPRRGPLFTP